MSRILVQMCRRGFAAVMLLLALAVAASALSAPATAEPMQVTATTSPSASQCTVTATVACDGSWKVTITVTTEVVVCFYTDGHSVEKTVTQTTTFTHSNLGFTTVGSQPVSLRVYLLGCGKGKELIKTIILKKNCPSASPSVSVSPSVSKSPSASPSSSKSPSPSASVRTSTSPSPGVSVSMTPLANPPGGSLPVTGVSVWLLVAVGVVVLVYGFSFYVLPWFVQFTRR